MNRARLIVMNAALGPLDYRVPHGMAGRAGLDRASRRSGPRQLIGVVWEPERLPTEEVGDNRLRNLLHVYDVAAARRAAAPADRVDGGLLSRAARLGAAHGAALLRRAGGRARRSPNIAPPASVPERLTPQRAQALERIGERQGLVRELAIIGGVSDGVIRGLVKAGAIEAVEVAIDDPFPEPDPDHAPPALDAAQAEAAAELARGGRRRRVRALPARRRHRLGQDRGLFRGDRRGDPRRAGRRSSCSPKSR